MPAIRGDSVGGAVAALKADRVATVEVTPSSASIVVSDTMRLTATTRDAQGNELTGRPVTWASSNTTIASVSPAGLVTAVGAGSASIMASSQGRSAAATLTVATPAPPPQPPPGSCALVTDWAPRPKSPLAKPGYLQTVVEPDFGSRLTRITGDPTASIPVIGGAWGDVVYHNYPKDQPWSADEALLVLKWTGVQGAMFFLDGNTYQPLFLRYAPGPEARWHPTLPDVMVYITSAGGVGHWNVRTNTSTLKYSPPPGTYSGALLGLSEGNVSYDGRYVVVQATRAADGRAVAYPVDIDAGTKGGDIDLNAFGVSAVDWVSVSALGGYVVVDGTIDGVGQRVKAWDRATGQQVQYWPTHPLGHFDLGVDQAGREVAFGGDAGSLNPKQFVTLDLGSGAVVAQSPAVSWNWHASTRANRRRGWGYAVTNDYTGTTLDGEIYALKLDGSRQIERYGRYRGVNNTYSAEPHAAPSPDGKRIVFASNWGSTTGPIQTYVLDIRTLCP